MSSCGSRSWHCQSWSHSPTYCCEDGSERFYPQEVTQNAIQIPLSPTAIPLSPEVQAANHLTRHRHRSRVASNPQPDRLQLVFLARTPSPQELLSMNPRTTTLKYRNCTVTQNLKLEMGPHSVAVEMSGRTLS